MNDFGPHSARTGRGDTIGRRARPDTSWGVGPWPVQTPAPATDRPTPHDSQEPETQRPDSA